MSYDFIVQFLAVLLHHEDKTVVLLHRLLHGRLQTEALSLSLAMSYNLCLSFFCRYPCAWRSSKIKHNNTTSTRQFQRKRRHEKEKEKSQCMRGFWLKKRWITFGKYLWTWNDVMCNSFRAIRNNNLIWFNFVVCWSFLIIFFL